MKTPDNLVPTQFYASREFCAELKQAAKSEADSISGFVRRAIKEKIARDKTSL